MNKIGITEKGDPSLHSDWLQWVAARKPAILITKNPAGLIDILTGVKDPNIIIHCTITSMGGSVIEPNVPSVENAVQGYNSLIERFGADRVVLRIDPIIPERLKPLNYLFSLVDNTETKIRTRVRISFLDKYKHVDKRLQTAGIHLNQDFHAPLQFRKAVLRAIQNRLDIDIEVCGEPGIECTGCISPLDCQILGVNASVHKSGQRRSCQCLAQKTELLKNKGQCFHGCLYCYWR
jgi:DNA repair photolyase